MENVVISREEMRAVYEEMKTPVKHGMILYEKESWIDCPNVFRKSDGNFVMVYVKFTPHPERAGYETWMAESGDLLHWKPVGKVLTQKDFGWDRLQVDGSVCLLDTDWEGDHSVHTYDGKYWMSYIGGALPGYEPDPLSIGMACSEVFEPGSFVQLPRPILSNVDPEVRAFERVTLYKSNVFYDEKETVGYPFVMFYNGKAGEFGIEKIGMAVSRDMVHWKRYGEDCVLSNEIEGRWNIAGDPQVIRYRDLWVMHYFVARDAMAYDTFACSRDLVHWTRWDGLGGEPLVKPSEVYDRIYAHKPYVLKHEGTVYHFYCAVGEVGRGIAVAASR